MYLLHHGPVAPDDPLQSLSLEQLEEQAAAEAEYLESLAPPSWFYPLVGQVASAAVLLEFYMTEVALALTRTDGTPREVIRSSQRMWQTLRAAAGLDERFDELLRAFQPARNERDAIVHAVLWWYDAEGPYSDRWEHHHPKTERLTVLDQDEPPEWMVETLHRIRDLTRRAFELSNAISAS
ncbi:hypothetical protein [Geodermatophilus sp. SYSU D00684]